MMPLTYRTAKRMVGRVLGGMLCGLAIGYAWSRMAMAGEAHELSTSSDGVRAAVIAQGMDPVLASRALLRVLTLGLLGTLVGLGWAASCLVRPAEGRRRR